MSPTQSRQLILQRLYEYMVGGENSDESFDLTCDLLGVVNDDSNLSQKERNNVIDTTNQIIALADELDKTIVSHCTAQWSLDRIAIINRCILRLAIYEMEYSDNVPNNVAISEAMVLATQFTDPRSSRFINGVLGSIDRQTEEG